MNKEDKIKFVESHRWYQQMNLGDGIVTPGTFNCQEALPKLQFPEDFRKKAYCDIGCNAGFFVLEAKKRGSPFAVGIDKEGEQIEKAITIADMLGVRVNYYQKDLYEMEYFPMKFNVVSAMSVFHHFKYPLEALRIIRRLTTELFIGEFACWIEGETVWLPLHEFPDNLGPAYHKAFPTVECVKTGLGRFFDEVEVIGECKLSKRIVFHATLKETK